MGRFIRRLLMLAILGAIVVTVGRKLGLIGSEEDFEFPEDATEGTAAGVSDGDNGNEGSSPSQG